ncbi:hypothetical protein [Fructilactobacillus cliffordii]|uniref:Uncharacterized protein n=1 Tax=Fructilactobacillus cliffordii TaxID=2940299 RepID=A0A9Q8ZSZ3_9LACO|nr:hypothetical protein [Fructilactobacillus cliffordii]USS89982.1 hypothetical protein M3M40_07280 [Fructilactobacillus cliffordii]
MNMKKVYVLQNLKNHSMIPKLFSTEALAFQYLNSKYPSLYERADKRGHFLGGFSEYETTIPYVYRIVVVKIRERDLKKLEGKYEYE